MEKKDAFQPFTPQDALEIPGVSRVALSDNGRLLVWQEDIPQGDRYFQVICLQERESGVNRRFPGRQPALSADGRRLAYLSPDGKLTIRDLLTGCLHRYGPYLRLEHLTWSPDGSGLAFSACQPASAQPGDLPSLETVQWVDRMKFKTDGVGIWDGAWRQIFYLDPKEERARPISQGRRDAAAPFWVGNDRIGWVANLHAPDYSDQDSLVIYSLTDGFCQMIDGPGGPIVHPAADPSGRFIAFLSHDNRYWEATNFNLYVASLPSGQIANRTRSLDRSVGNYILCDVGLSREDGGLCWTPDSRQIYALLTDRSRCQLCRFDRETGKLSPLTQGARAIFGYAVCQEGIALLYTSPDRPAVIAFQNGKGEETVLWEPRWLAGRKLPVWQEFSFPGFDGSPRQGFYLAPAQEPRGVVLNIHGGPHYCYGETFSIDAQLLASRGYGVVICNPAGSQGAGEAVSRASKHDWGGKDYRELMTCVDTASRLFSLGEKRWGVMGGSYGGFLTNWIIGHTDRFSCAVAERSTCNRYSQAGTSDCAFRYGEYEFDGLPWDHPDHYLAHSPITYVRSIHTPLLLIHGDEDMNCPISQSEEMFSALRLLHKEVYFARFPGQSHGMSARGTPNCRLDRYRLLLWWMDRYLDREGTAEAEKEEQDV